MKQHYDIFISYRRLDEQGNISGRDQAHLIAKQLELVGYHPFFDYSEITDDVFAEVILPAVKTSKVFILVLTKNALDRCKNEDDWVRREIETAINSGNKIINVSPDNTFNRFPDNLPKSLERIKGILISEINFGQLFDSSMAELIDQRIAPKIGRPKKKIVSLYYAIAAFLLPFFFMLIYNNYESNRAYDDVNTAYREFNKGKETKSAVFNYCCRAIKRGSIDAYYHTGLILGHQNENIGQKLFYKKGYDEGSYRCAFGLGEIYYNQFVRLKGKNSTKDSINGVADSASEYFKRAEEGPRLWDNINNFAKGQGFVDEISDKDKDTLQAMKDSLSNWKKKYKMFTNK